MSWQKKIFKPSRFSAVVKVGGSLVFSPHVGAVRRELENHAGSGVLVLTGGGKLDDLIEDYAKRNGLAPRSFHLATLLAQDQCALLLADGSDLLRVVSTIDEAENALKANQVPILMPSTLVLASDLFRYTNRFSSDTMAAWLAQLVSTPHLIVVKSRRPPSPNGPVDAGFVDEVFHEFVEWSGVAVKFATHESLGACLPADQQGHR